MEDYMEEDVKYKYTLDIILKPKDLYYFSMRHTYACVSGVFGIGISLGSLIICAVKYKDFSRSKIIVLLIIGALFTVVQPVMLYVKSLLQYRQNKNVNKALHYEIGEDGIRVSSDGQAAEVRWEDVRNYIHTGKFIYVYMSSVSAFIFPADRCDGKFDEIVKYIDDKYRSTQAEENDI